jgi:dephospho-CoA kinase
MLVVGLTGGIASGKSTVSDMFREQGVPVICADELAKAAVNHGSPALEEIRRALGDEVINSDGTLDRTAVARIVFRDESKRRALEGIIHPRVATEQNCRLRELEAAGHRLAVLDVPLLYETGWERYVALVVVVYVPRAIQERRLILRDGMSSEEARARLAAQMDIEEKRTRADRLIDNSQTPETTRAQLMNILKELRDLAIDVPAGEELAPAVLASRGNC